MILKQPHFFNTTHDLFLFQHIHDCTRFRSGQNPSLLDNIFTDEENQMVNLKYEAPTELIKVITAVYPSTTWHKLLNVLSQVPNSTTTTVTRHLFIANFTRLIGTHS